jgi:electron transfer flavoprotein alpha subunit
MSNTVWVVLQHRDGKLHKMSWEAIRAGQILAAAIGGRAEAVLLGDAVRELADSVAESDLGAVWMAEDSKLADYTPGGYLTALAAAAARSQPLYWMFPHTYQTVDYAPRLAQILGAALVPEVTGFAVEDDGAVFWQRPILNGKLEARVRARGGGPVVVSVQSSAFPADEVVPGTAPVQSLDLDTSTIRPDRRILGVEEAAADQVDLSQSSYIVAVGRGIGDPEKMAVVEELAAVLGGELGASRPVIDSGWLPRERQIGSSGQTVAPKLYLAAGISGAIQHLVGMKGSQVIVAINKDRTAPIFNVAHYGIVGDLHEVVPALTEAVRQAKSS